MGSLLRLAGCAVLTLTLLVGVVGLSSRIFGIPFDRRAFLDLLAQQRRQDELADRAVAARHRTASRGVIAAAVIDGRSTLFEAAEAFRRLDAELPWVEPVEESELCRQVIALVREQLLDSDRIPDRQDLLDRLDHDYRERFARSPVVTTP